MDSGNFIYQNNGVNWIVDLGSEYYTSADYFSATRYYYYRNSGEGNNVVVLTSAKAEVPLGQVGTGSGDMYETYVDPNGQGSYAIINNSNVYGSYSQAAYRGMLVTNDRKTVVIQDEISLTGPGDLTWIAHTEAEIVAAEGKVAYLAAKDEAGDTIYLRATLVTSLTSLAFQSVGLNSDKILSNRYGISKDGRSLDGISRLVIEAKNVMTAQFAVVFEEIEYYGADTEVGYEWIDLNNWNSSAFVEETVEDTTARRGTAVKRNIASKTTEASVYMDDGIAFTDFIVDFYILLADVKYVLKAFYIRDENSFSASEEDLLEAYEEYLDYESRYNTFAGLANKTNKEMLDYVDVLAGF